MDDKKQINALATDIYSMLRSDSMSRAMASMLFDKGWRNITNDTEEKHEKYFSPEDVRKMTREEVRENYQAIFNSMREWH
jgi:hypothetical protein